MVPRELVEDIRQRINLVQLVEQVVSLKRSGRNYQGLCPFHQEKSPSFTVSEDKQLYHCFGCGAGGTAYTFLMNYYHLSFPEALEKAAAMVGIELKQVSEADTKKSKALSDRKTRLLHIMNETSKAYHHVLIKSSRAAGARTYVKSRGLSADTVAFFQMGYAPSAWDNLAKYLQSKKYSLEDAKAAGLLSSKKDGNYVDFFRDRLIFPIRSTTGETIGFGGRVFGDEQPKYLNSPQTDIFDKGKNLFGLYEAQDEIRKQKFVLITEGYMDQIALYQAGFKNSVATLGTALTVHHAKLIKKFADKVMLVFDGDAAGLKATLKAMKPLLSEGVSTWVIALPTKEDPDSIIQKHGAKKFSEFVETAKPVIQFYLDKFYLSERDVSKKSLAIAEMVDIVKNSSTYMREAIIKEIKDATGISENILRGESSQKELFKPKYQNQKMIISREPKTSTSLGQFSNEELVLLRLSLEVKDVLQIMLTENVFALFTSPHLADLARDWLTKVGSQVGDKSRMLPDLLDQWIDEPTKGDVAKTLMESSFDSITDWDKVYADCIGKLKKRKLTNLKKEIQDAELRGDEVSVQELSVKVFDLKKSFVITKH